MNPINYTRLIIRFQVSKLPPLAFPIFATIDYPRKYSNVSLEFSTHHLRVSQLLIFFFSILVFISNLALFSPSKFRIDAIRGCIRAFSRCFNALVETHFFSLLDRPNISKNRSDRARSITRLFKWRHSRDISSEELAALKIRWEWALSCLLDAEKISNSRENAFFSSFLSLSFFFVSCSCAISLIFFPFFVFFFFFSFSFASSIHVVARYKVKSVLGTGAIKGQMRRDIS